ncbi:MAG: metallophosphoesterase [Flavobacteriaceae bacterium]
MRTLVIGDIHGGHKALKQVLDKVELRKDDVLVFLGDYVDGWSESAKTVSSLISLSSDYECVFLRGNHDDLCHKWLAKKEMPELWLQHGGLLTIEGYRKLDTAERENHLNFYENMKDYHIDDSNRLFVHAGFQNLHDPKMEYHQTAFYWDRTLWEMALALDNRLSEDDDKYPARLKLFKEIYIGHTPVVRIGETKPYQAANVWNVDTGAAFKGPLSVIDADSKKVWQSDPVWTLYPDENGRN